MEMIEKFAVYSRLLLNIVENHFLHFARSFGNSLQVKLGTAVFYSVKFLHGIYQKLLKLVVFLHGVIKNKHKNGDVSRDIVHL